MCYRQEKNHPTKEEKNSKRRSEIKEKHQEIRTQNKLKLRGGGINKGKAPKMRIQKMSKRGEANEDDIMSKTSQSLRKQIQCDAQGGITSLLHQKNILPIFKFSLPLNDKTYMISFQMFSH